MNLKVLLTSFLFFSAACGIHATEYSGDSHIWIYTHTRPSCPVREIGEITWLKNGRSDIADRSEELRKIVAEMKGDAIMIDGDLVEAAAASIFLVGIREFRGTVVKFDERCDDRYRAY